METCYFANVNGSFVILPKFIQIFRENLDNHFGKFENLHLKGVPGVESNEARESIKIVLEQWLETSNFCKFA